VTSLAGQLLGLVAFLAFFAPALDLRQVRDQPLGVKLLGLVAVPACGACFDLRELRSELLALVALLLQRPA